MKKIISVLALTSLAIGATFADVKFSVNYKTGMTAFSRVMSVARNDDGSAVTGTNPTAFNDLYATYLFKQSKGYCDAVDTTTISASNDFGGVNFQFGPYAESSNGTLTTRANFKQWNAFIKIGSIGIYGGFWADGKMAGSYQLKNDQDNSNFNGADGIGNKLGSAFKSATTNQVTDIVGFAGSTAPSVFVEYTGDVGAAEIAARLSAISLGNTSWVTDTSDPVFSGFAAQIDTKFEQLDAELTFKQASLVKGKEERAVSLYVMPTLPVTGLSLSVGGALGFYAGDLGEYNVEARLRYVNGPMSVSMTNNVSHVTRDQVTNKGIAEYKTNKGAWWLSGGSTGTYGITNVATTVMVNEILFRYKINDTFTALFHYGDTVGLRSYSITHKCTDNFGDYGIEMFFAPGVQIFATAKTSIATYARIGLSHVGVTTGDDSDYFGKDFAPEMAIVVPVIFRVRL